MPIRYERAEAGTSTLIHAALAGGPSINPTSTEVTMVTDITAAAPPAIDKPRLRRSEASAYLLQRHGVTLSPSTLAKLAVIGGGPAFRKDGRLPVYDVAELDRFAVARLGQPLASTSEGRAA